MIRLLVRGINVEGPSFTVSDENPVPRVVGLTPAEIRVGSTSANINISGTGFLNDSTLYLDGEAVTPRSRTATSFQVSLDGTFLAQQARHVFVVENPGPGGGRSEDASFVVNGPFDLLSATVTSRTAVELEFDIAPSAAHASQASNFPVVVDGTSNNLEVTRAVQGVDPRKVILTTAPQTEGVAYRVWVTLVVKSEFGGYIRNRTATFVGFSSDGDPP